MTKKIKGFFLGAALVPFLAVPLASNAATIEDAMAVARQYGIPEDTIQQCLNEYYKEPDLYPPEVIDAMIAQFKEQVAVITNVPYNPDAAPEIPTTPIPDDSPDDVPVPDNSITLTMPDGSTFTRISKEDFIALSYDDKMAYLGTFTDEQQTVFIENLSPEEYRSMIKQLPSEEKLEIVDSMTKMADSFDLNVTVDEISDDNISYSMKNKDGELVASSSIKETVDNTGYDRRGVLSLAFSLIASGFVGLFAAARKCFGKDSLNG